MAGVAVDESALVPLHAAIQRVMRKHLDAHLWGLELHAQHMRAGKGPWRGVPRPLRDALVQDVVGTLLALRRRRPHDLTAFAAVHAPGALPKADTLERTFEEQRLRFTQMLVRFNPGAQEPRGMVVADSAR